MELLFRIGNDTNVASVSQQAAALAIRLNACADVRIRIQYLRNEIRSLEADALADMVTVVAGSAEAGEPHHANLLLAVAVALADPSLTSLRRAAADLARTRGQDDAARLLDVPSEDPHALRPRRTKTETGRPLTLGERKSLARRRERNLLARAIRDPHPDVIRILLTNPALTEDDVVRLCAGAHTPPSVLREVFRNPTWVVCYRVRRTIVKNPQCPADIALQLATLLTAPDAQEIAQTLRLPLELRQACARRSRGVIH